MNIAERKYIDFLEASVENFKVSDKSAFLKCSKISQALIHWFLSVSDSKWRFSDGENFRSLSFKIEGKCWEILLLLITWDEYKT